MLADHRRTCTGQQLANPLTLLGETLIMRSPPDNCIELAPEHRGTDICWFRVNCNVGCLGSFRRFNRGRPCRIELHRRLVVTSGRREGFQSSAHTSKNGILRDRDLVKFDYLGDIDRAQIDRWLIDNLRLGENWCSPNGIYRCSMCRNGRHLRNDGLEDFGLGLGLGLDSLGVNKTGVFIFGSRNLGLCEIDFDRRNLNFDLDVGLWLDINLWLAFQCGNVVFGFLSKDRIDRDRRHRGLRRLLQIRQQDHEALVGVECNPLVGAHPPHVGLRRSLASCDAASDFGEREGAPCLAIVNHVRQALLNIW